MREETPVSLWEMSAEESDCVSPMDGDITTDLAIIGGGFTGLSTALHAAERGMDCHVLEARHIGHGGSGRNVGLVNAGLWLPPQDVRARLGESRGSGLIKVLGDAPAYVFSLIDRHQIRCEATRSGTIHAAHSPRGYANLARRAEEWHRLGAPVELLSREEAAAKIGGSAFHGGLLDHRAGMINPMGYVRGLARAALAAGAKISTGASAKKLRRDSRKWVVHTDTGTVKANSVVLCTNAYSDNLWPGLNNTFMKIYFFQLATAPLGDRVNAILPGGQGLWDTGLIMFSLRRDSLGRIVIGSMGKLIGGHNGLSRRWAARTLHRLFPDLGTVEFETSWHGSIALTGDHLPRIHRLADGLYTVIGYNGRGIAPGTIFGKAMAELLSGGQEAGLPLAITAPKPARRHVLMSQLYQAMFAGNQLVRSI